MVTKHTNIDLSYNNSGLTIANIQKDDNMSRQIDISLYHDGIPYTIPAGAVIMLQWDKPDGTTILENSNGSLISVNNDVISIILSNQMTTSEGIVKAKLSVIYNSSTLYSSLFKVKVAGGLIPEDKIVSSDEYNALVDSTEKSLAAAYKCADVADICADATTACINATSNIQERLTHLDEHAEDNTIHITSAERNLWNTVSDKIDSIASGAEVNVQSDWAESDSSSDAYIKNKPHFAISSNDNGAASYVEFSNIGKLPTSVSFLDYQPDTSIDDDPVLLYKKENNVIPLSFSEIHSTAEGNKHIPNGGTEGQILLWAADGTAKWGTSTAISAIQDGNGNVIADTYLKISNLLDAIYPVGSIYMSANSANPSTLFGGSWEAWGSGRVPVGVDSVDTDFNTAEKEGGEKTHSLTTTEMPSHTHDFTGTASSHTHTFTGTNKNTGTVSAQHTHSGTTSSNGNHSHTANGGSGLVGSGTLGNDAKIAQTGGSYRSGLSTNTTGAHTHTMTTSNPSANHTHNYTPSGKNANTSITPEGTNSSVGDNTAHNNLQPYITCYMWKRTA